jgi:hypothetical protein
MAMMKMYIIVGWRLHNDAQADIYAVQLHTAGELEHLLWCTGSKQWYAVTILYILSSG